MQASLSGRWRTTTAGPTASCGSAARMIAMLAKTVQSVSAASEENVDAPSRLRETERQRLQSERTTARSKWKFRRASGGSIDQSQPGHARSEAGRSEKPAYVVVMVVDRLQSYDVMFG